MSLHCFSQSDYKPYLMGNNCTMTRLFFQFWEIYWSLLLYLYAHYMIWCTHFFHAKNFSIHCCESRGFFAGKFSSQFLYFIYYVTTIYYHGRQPPDPANLRLTFFSVLACPLIYLFFDTVLFGQVFFQVCY